MLPCSQCTLILVLERMGQFQRQIAAWLQPPWRQCTLFVCSNVKPLCHRKTGISKMYAANPG